MVDLIALPLHANSKPSSVELREMPELWPLTCSESACGQMVRTLIHLGIQEWAGWSVQPRMYIQRSDDNNDLLWFCCSRSSCRWQVWKYWSFCAAVTMIVSSTWSSIYSCHTLNWECLMEAILLLKLLSITIHLLRFEIRILRCLSQKVFFCPILWNSHFW